jgi:hypothetical protein
MNFKDVVIAAGSAREELLDNLLRRSRPGLEKALKNIRRPEAAVGAVKSPLGDLLVATSARGLVLMHYLERSIDFLG